MALKKQQDPALREVVERQPRRDLGGLLAQLRDPDPQQRRWGARDLVEHPQAATVLAERLQQEADLGVREAIFTTLEKLAGPLTAAALLPLLRSEDAGLRNGAIEALAAMPEATAPQVDVLLADGDADVRLFAVNLLADLRHPQVPAWLEQVLREEQVPNVVAGAIEVLAEVGTSALLPALEGARRRFSEDPFIGFAADIARERMAAS